MIGQRINNYEVKGLLGEGGMGSVYIAEHPVLGRRTAIKVLRREFADNAELVSRFINEARAASAIRHPGIIEVFDVGTMADGLPYLMMELLEGETLARCVERERRLPVVEAVELFRQAAAALAAAHEHGIVHRDLKPENIFLVGSGRQRRVKILDFGIAKLHRNLGARAVHTHTGSVMGTPQYMSPEQCRGISGEIDHRTDIYALGVILHEMLAGTPPFVSEGYGDLLIMHLTAAPPRLRSIDPDIPAAVEACVLRALEKTRDRRFASVDEMARAIADAAARPTARDGSDLHRGGTEATLPPWTARPSSIPELRRHTTFSATNGQMSAVDDDGTVDLRPRRRRVVVGTFVGVAVGVTLAAALATRQWGPPSPVPAPSAASLPDEATVKPQLIPPAPAATPTDETAARTEPAAAPPSTPDAGAPAVVEEANPAPREDRTERAPAAGARPPRDRRRPARAAPSPAAAVTPGAGGNAPGPAESAPAAAKPAAAGGATGTAVTAPPATPPPPAALKTEKW